MADNRELSPAVSNKPDLADLHRDLDKEDTAPWSDTTPIVRRADAHRPGKDILMFGSHTLWNDLLLAGLVTELHLMLGATVVGGGTPAFGAGPVPSLRLLRAHRRDGSDNLLLRYHVGQEA